MWVNVRHPVAMTVVALRRVLSRPNAPLPAPLPVALALAALVALVALVALAAALVALAAVAATVTDHCWQGGSEAGIASQPEPRWR